MHNPNSAVERIKNHLAYKLGQAMIEYNKNGGGYLSLFKKLYNIKKQHKKEKQIYQETIKVFPTLKYPELKQCPDYNEALKCYFHLSYMLGEALIKSYQSWYRGGGFKLYSYIKKAKKEFKLFQDIFKEFDQINSNTIEGIAKNKQLFLKEFPKIKNLLNTHKDYKPIIDNIFHNFDYVIKKINLIEEWLLSNDFNEKYKKENHPYPSLLDPKKLNDEKEEINYKTIPAELAWEMNLPLPDNYEFVFIGFTLCGHVAMDLYLKKCSCNLIYANEMYKNFLYLKHKSNTVLCIASYLKKNLIFEQKILRLINDKIPILILVRDPIERLKTGVNHGCHPEGKNFHDIFFVQDNLDEVLDRIRYYLNGYYYDNPLLETVDFMLKNTSFYISSFFSEIKNNVLYIDINEISPNRSFYTLKKISKILHFNKPKPEDLSYFEEYKVNDFKYILPLILDVYYKEKKISIYIESIIQNEDQKIDIFKFIFSDEHKFYNKVHFYIDIDNFYFINYDNSFFNYIKKYLSDFLNKLDLKINKVIKHKVNGKNILEYFKINKKVRIKFKNILDKELIHIKQHRPDIVASWKYYQEFEKMCEELDKQEVDKRDLK